jgi:hypothetical protein
MVCPHPVPASLSSVCRRELLDRNLIWNLSHLPDGLREFERFLDGLPKSGWAAGHPESALGAGARTSHSGDLASPVAGEALERWTARAQPGTGRPIEASSGSLVGWPLIVDYEAATPTGRGGEMADDLKGVKVAIWPPMGSSGSSSHSRGERCTVRALPR